METDNLILVEKICSLHEIEISFVDALQQYGLIEVVEMENNQYLPNEQLRNFEKMMRLHYELNINLEGIDAISNLLQRIDQLEKDLIAAKNKLRILEY